MIRENSSDFVKNFYGIYLSKEEKNRFETYLKAISLRKKNLTAKQISEKSNISKSTIEKWIFNYNRPFVAQLYEHYKELKNSQDKKWVSINSTRGGLFTGPWIRVPTKIKSFKDIEEVLLQIQELKEYNEKNIGFNYALKRENKFVLFAYLLGFLIGDAAKLGVKRKNRINRRITVMLSKGYKTNLRLGNFVSLCVNSIGLRMSQSNDCPAGKKNTFAFYRWLSQSSMLIQWIFRVCLGLNDKEKTTYNKIRAEWIVNTPREFRISFLQGLADSDGFVDLSSKKIGIITHPNTDLIAKILDSLNVKYRRWLITRTGLWTLIISIKDAYKLPIFNPYIKSYRYQKMVKLFKAKRIKGHWPKWLSDNVDDILRSGIKGTKVVEKILDEYAIAIGTKAIKKHERKIFLKGDNMKNKKQAKLICLGIESTAR